MIKHDLEDYAKNVEDALRDCCKKAGYTGVHYARFAKYLTVEYGSRREVGETLPLLVALIPVGHRSARRDVSLARALEADARIHVTANLLHDLRRIP